MVKKISVFITILALFFVGIPQFNSKANADTVSFTFQNGYSDGSQYNLNKYLELLEYTTLGYVDFSDFYVGAAAAGDMYRLVADSIRDNTTGEYYTEFAILDDTNSTLWRLTSGGYVTNNVFGDNAVLDFKLSKNTDFSNGYNQGREEYGIYYNGEWLTAIEFANIRSEESYRKGLQDGEKIGYDDGYYDGLNEQDATGFVGLLGAVFGGLGSLLAIELLPGIHIGAIIAVPLVFGIIFFILGKREGD